MSRPADRFNLLLLALFLTAAIAVAKERRIANTLRLQLDTLRVRSSATITDLTLKAGGYRRLNGYVRLTRDVMLEGTDSNGSDLMLRPLTTAGRTLLYSIVPHCPSCWAPLPFLNAVASSRGCDVQVLVIVVGDSLAFRQVDNGRSHVRLMFDATGSMWNALPLSSPGSTALFGDSGRLDALWPGTPAGFPFQDVAAHLGSQCVPSTTQGAPTQ